MKSLKEKFFRKEEKNEYKKNVIIPRGVLDC